jgi:transcriptional regulator with XRE-family HTH domain
LRLQRKLTTRELADELRREGVAIDDSSITKLEKGDRRITVDDLVALACALDVTVDRLLLPMAYEEDDQILITPARAVPSAEAWDWARGSFPLRRRPDEPRPHWGRALTRRFSRPETELTDEDWTEMSRRPLGEWQADVLPETIWRHMGEEDFRRYLKDGHAEARSGE